MGMANTNKIPVTFVIRRLINPVYAKEYEQWLRFANEEVHKFTGNLGIFVIRPLHAHHPEYILVIEFDTEENLQLFKKSKMRQKWLSDLEKFSLGPADERDLTALNAWFGDGNIKYERDFPAKYKTAILAIVSALPFVMLINFLLKHSAFYRNYYVNLTLTLSLTIIILTYIVIPWLSKRLQFWLYR